MNPVHIAVKGSDWKKVLCKKRYLEGAIWDWNPWESYRDRPNDFNYCPECVKAFNKSQPKRTYTETEIKVLVREEARVVLKTLLEQMLKGL